MDSLSPETRREIESRLDSTAGRTGDIASAFLRYAKHALWVIPVLMVVAFLADSAALHFSRMPTATVTIKRYYAVGLKNGKTEMYYADPETQTCVNSIFPHMGDSPCWYLRKHNIKEIRV